VVTAVLHCTKARARPSRPSMRCAAGSVTAIISLTHNLFLGGETRGVIPPQGCESLRQVRALTLSQLPNTNATSAILANVPGSVVPRSSDPILAAGRWRLMPADRLA